MVIYVVNSDSELLHMMKISMKRFHISMFGSPSSLSFSSSFPINRFAYMQVPFLYPLLFLGFVGNTH